MDLDKYQQAALKTCKMSDRWYFALGLAGETGEVIERIKKFYRDDKGIPSPERIKQIKLELGDTLWYLAVLADSFGLSLNGIARSNLEKLSDRDSRQVIHGEGDDR